MKVLIVDDDALVRAMLENVLKRAGHEVRRAENGREALSILETETYRIVITDWEMPEMTGVELCRAIRANEYAGYIYTILLTSRESSSDTVEGLASGADDFIVKPFDPAALAERMRTAQRILSLETRDLAIFAMAKLAESRDPETGLHLERVRNYSRLLAKHLSGDPRFAGQVDANYVRLIYLTSPLHDIGKVAIPDSVLLKPGRLSDREFDIMKLHAELGAKTLDAALQQHPEAHFLKMASDIASSHHERFDGTGYPNKLAGANIPLSGRIVAVADVYDALTSKRVYKAAFTHEVAKSIIIKDSGTHFDPDVVDAFLKTEEQFIEIQSKYAETFAIAA